MIHLEFLLLVLAAALLPAGRTRLLATGGAISAGLAAAGLGAGPVEVAGPLPAGFVAVEGALFALATALALAAAALGAKAARWGAAAAVAAGLGLGLSAVPKVRVAAPLALLTAAIAMAALGLAMVWVGARLGRWSVAQDRSQISPTGLAAIGVGGLLATVSPWADLILVGAALAAAGGWACTQVRDHRRLPIAPVLTLVLLPAWWLMRTIAGPEGLATVSLPDLPWSPAAERLLGAVLLVGAWAMSGLWPLHREEPAALTTPVAALLMARIATPAFPNGLEHWRALALPLVLVGLWHGVLTGNRAEALAALAWVGLVTAAGAGEAGAGLILVGGLVLVVVERLARAEALLQPVAALAIGAGTLLVTEAGLRTEVVYTVCAVAALVAAAGRWNSAQASTASALSATAPRA